MEWCAHLGDHGKCECTIVNSPPGPPGPAGDRGDAGMTGEFGQEGDVGDPGPQGEDGVTVRMIESSSFILFFLFILSPFLFPQTFLFPCLAGIPWTQWLARPKRSKRGKECGHTERCSVSIISSHFRSTTAIQGGHKTDFDLCCVCMFCMCLVVCVCMIFCVCLCMCVYHYRISWRPRASWARWGAGSTGCSRPNRFAWFPWEPRSSSELTVISIMTVS